MHLRHAQVLFIFIDFVFLIKLVAFLFVFIICSLVEFYIASYFQITSAYLPATNALSIATSTKGTIGNIVRRYLSRAIGLTVAEILLYPFETVLNR